VLKFHGTNYLDLASFLSIIFCAVKYIAKCTSEWCGGKICSDPSNYCKFSRVQPFSERIPKWVKNFRDVV